MTHALYFDSKQTTKLISTGMLLSALLLNSGCTSIKNAFNTDLDYTHSTLSKKLEIPPDLTPLTHSKNYSAGDVISASTLAATKAKDKPTAVSGSAAKHSPAIDAATPQATLLSSNDALELPGDYDSAWQRVGLALERASFTIISGDQVQGKYTVQDIRNGKPAELGFFAKLFVSNREAAEAAALKMTLTINLKRGAPNVVTAPTQADKPANAAIIKDVLTVLHRELK
jgi:uncharacterized lipoprotein